MIAARLRYPAFDPEPDGIERRQEEQRQHRAGSGATDQCACHGSPKYGGRERDERQNGRERRQEDGSCALHRGFDYRVIEVNPSD